MNKPLLIYCYDAWCGWCYGFSNVIKNVSLQYAHLMEVEVLSGGMLLPDKPVHIGVMADYILKAIPFVEQTTGIRFGDDFLWHLRHPEQSDWYPHSELPAIALCILKELRPEKSMELTSDFQYALHMEGRDLTDAEAYRHLLEKYAVDPDEFYAKLESENYRDMAHQEFALVRQLKVDGYPAVFVQTDSTKLYLVGNGYTTEEELVSRIQSVLQKSH